MHLSNIVLFLLTSASLTYATPFNLVADGQVSALTTRQSTLACPAGNGTTFTSTSGAAYVVECGIDRLGDDLKLIATAAFADCINACSTISGCVDVSWVSTNNLCYMKNGVSASVTTRPAVFGARLASASLQAAPISCPAANGQSYTVNGETFILECSIDHRGGDQSVVYTPTYVACISACAANPACLVVSWALNYSYCYMKNITNPGLANSNVWGARLSNAQAPAAGVSVASTTVTSTTISSSPPATVVSKVTSSTVSATHNPTVTQKPSSAAPVCPGSHGSRYISSSGVNFLIECFTDRPGGDLQPAPYSIAGSLVSCLNTCALTSGCVDVTYTQSTGGCWLKSSLTAATNGNTDQIGARVIAPAALSPQSTPFAGPQYPGYAGLKYWFAFGDSYSANGFNVNGVQPGPGNPLGNDGNATALYETTAAGPNYVVYLANVNSSSPINMYDIAMIGAVVDPTSLNVGPQLAHPAIQQISYDWLENYVDNPSVPWTPQNSMFSIYFGINDCDDLFNFNATTQSTYLAADMAAYRFQMEQLYVEGARNFLVVNTSPTSRTPGWLQFQNATNQANLAAVILIWNQNLVTMVQQLQAEHADMTIITFDAWSFFTNLLNGPPAQSTLAATYPMLKGINDYKNWCGQYGPGNPTGGNQWVCDPACTYGCIYNYFWTDFIHPSWVVHQAMAGEIRKLL